MTLHLEMTTRCNASCPLCARNLKGGQVDPNLKITELKLSDIKKALPPEIVSKINFLFMCGNFGDPAVAQDTLEAFKYFRATNPKMRLMMMTNGSVRATAWWRELAGVIDECEFGIDGLSDTHAIYRRGTQFEKVIENARAFISAGGNASWQFIVFRHNQHQVEEAREMALSLGFKKFFTRKTSRFFGKAPVLSATGELEYELEMPTDARYLNSSFEQIDAVSKKYGNLEKYFDKCEIECKSQKENALFLSAEGVLWPCCWLAQDTRSGFSSLSALEIPFNEILKSDFFTRSLPSSWQKPSLLEGKPQTCAKNCGKEVDLFKNQFSQSVAAEI